MAGSQAISEEEEEFSLTYCDSLFTVLETGERALSDLGDSAPPWRCFPMSRFTYAVFPPVALALVFAGCQSAYYGTMQTIGVEKREILRDRIGDWREVQQQAKAEVDDAYHLFTTLSFTGELESFYKELDKAAGRVAGGAEDVTGRIERVEMVGVDVFQEWTTGVGEIQNASLRASSEKTLQSARARYQGLLDSMRNAEGKMALVVTAFRDRVIFLKHNLTEQTVSDLKTVTEDMQREIQPMGRAIDVATAEADEFVATLPD
jgi:hypothetical protein